MIKSFLAARYGMPPVGSVAIALALGTPWRSTCKILVRLHRDGQVTATVYEWHDKKWRPRRKVLYAALRPLTPSSNYPAWLVTPPQPLSGTHGRVVISPCSAR